MARIQWPPPRGIFPTGAYSWQAFLRFHQYGQAQYQYSRSAFGSPYISFRSDLFELGDRLDMLFREFWKPEQGLQNALMDLGGVHLKSIRQTGCQRRSEKLAVLKSLPAAIRLCAESLWNKWPQKSQPSSPNENGDVEQRNHRFKKALDQVLMLRGSRDFASRGNIHHSSGNSLSSSTLADKSGFWRRIRQLLEFSCR